jgi:hypothetical protein
MLFPLASLASKISPSAIWGLETGMMNKKLKKYLNKKGWIYNRKIMQLDHKLFTAKLMITKLNNSNKNHKQKI